MDVKTCEWCKFFKITSYNELCKHKNSLRKSIIHSRHDEYFGAKEMRSNWSPYNTEISKDNICGPDARLFEAKLTLRMKLLNLWKSITQSKAKTVK